MRIFKSHPLLRLVNSYVIDSPQPSNLSYLWNFGSLLAFCLIIQIVTGVTLAMHYNPSVLEAFNSVEHIMRDVNNGWLIRYLHSNTASAFFFLVYLHIGRNLYYSSYKAPRTLSFALGVVILVVMMATAFLGYVLPYGQMSLWGATVITNLMSAIPWIGQDIVEFIWGGFSVNNATLNRFFALHFVLPFVIAALVLMHLIALHDTVGSSNPLGISGNYDRLAFAPYFIFKDLVTIFLFILVLSVFVFFMPNVLGDSENYVMANPMQTPPAIVPEWYLLPFYAILRSIPNKLLGVIAMFAALVILLTLPFTDLSRTKGAQFKPLSKIIYYIFVANFLMLMVLGAKHVESPFIELGQISTVIYFLYFLFLVPQVTLLENTLIEMPTTQKSSSSYSISMPLNANILGIFNRSIPKPYNFVKEPLQSAPWSVPAMVQKCRESKIPNPRNTPHLTSIHDENGRLKRDQNGAWKTWEGHTVYSNGLQYDESNNLVRDEIGNKYKEGRFYCDKLGYRYGTKSNGQIDLQAKYNDDGHLCTPEGYRIVECIYQIPVDKMAEYTELMIKNNQLRNVRILENLSTATHVFIENITRKMYANPRGEWFCGNHYKRWEGGGPYNRGVHYPPGHFSKPDQLRNYDSAGRLINKEGRLIDNNGNTLATRYYEDPKTGNIIDEYGRVDNSQVAYVEDGVKYDENNWSFIDRDGIRRHVSGTITDVFGNILQTNKGRNHYSWTEDKWIDTMSQVDKAHQDSPRPWGLYFQDSASPQMEGLTELHDNIMFYLVIILFAVGWILISVVRNYSYKSSPISHKYSNHGTLIELVWTITPALILILIAFPSFKLLYLMDEVSDPAMAVLAEGHQWYWSYQYPDFLNADEEFVEFDSYLVPESDLEDGTLRMLEVDNRVILPELTHVRFIVTAADVIHSYACPALGIKCDAYPGRLSQLSLLINREGVFYGQCSEICGILHSSMPIVIQSLPIEKFLSWLEEQ